MNVTVSSLTNKYTMNIVVVVDRCQRPAPRAGGVRPLRRQHRAGRARVPGAAVRGAGRVLAPPGLLHLPVRRGVLQPSLPRLHPHARLVAARI